MHLAVGAWRVAWMPAFAGMTFAPGMFPHWIARPTHGRDDAIARDGQVAHAHAERIEHRVGDGARHRPVRGLAGPQGFLFGAGNDLHLHGGHFREAQDGIGLPGVAGDARAVEAHRFLQHPARGLDGAALDLVFHAVRIDDLAHVHRHDEPAHADVGGAFDLGDDGAIGARALVARKADAVPRAFALAPVVPAGARGRRFDDGPRPRVLQMAQAEGHRVLAALGRQLVHEQLDGEHVGKCAERPQRRGADRHGEQAVVGDCPGREVVGRRGIALRPAAAGQRRIDGRHARKRLGELPGRVQRRRLGAAGPRHVSVAPDVVPPADDLALRVEIGFEVDRPARRRTAPTPSRPRATTAGSRAAPCAARASSAASRPTSSAPFWP